MSNTLWFNPVARPGSAWSVAVICTCVWLSGWQGAEAEDRIFVDHAIKVARELTQSKNVFDRLTAAGTLVDIGDKASLALLLETARSTDFVVQRSAIDTLLSVQHPDGLDTIYRVASEDQGFRNFLIESLATRPRKDMGEFLIHVLGTEDSPRTQRYALQALIKSDTPRLFERMTEFVADDRIDATTRAYVYCVLSDLGHGSEVFAKLLEIVDTGSGSQQEAAAVALGLIDTGESRIALGKLRGSSDQRVVLAALASDAGLGNDEAVSQMVHLITYGKPMEATVAAGSLKRLPPRVASEITQVVLGCCKLKPDVAGRLLESWGWIDSDASSVYAWGLTHEDADVRLQTLWLVGQRRDRSMLEPLAGFLDDSNEAIRGMAAWAIVHIAADAYSGLLEASAIR